jgi:hypothetical protein
MVEEGGREDVDNDFDFELTWERYLTTRLHLLMSDLALQAYCRDHGRPPDALAELVPEYLAEVPVDALGDAPLRYRREGSAYRVYSVGWNEVDDGGLVDDPFADVNGDCVTIGPHVHPLPKPVRSAFASAWSGISNWLKAATDEAVKAALRIGN